MVSPVAIPSQLMRVSAAQGIKLPSDPPNDATAREQEAAWMQPVRAENEAMGLCEYVKLLKNRLAAPEMSPG